MTRTLLSASIHELEKAYEDQRHDPDFLAVLDHELGFRKTDRATRLHEEVRRARSSTPSTASAPPQEPVGDAAPSSSSPATTVGSDVRPAARIPPPPPISNSPAEILAAWTALEVLSPQSFRKPEQLAANRARGLVAQFERGLPWERGGESSRPQQRLFYQVVLGTIDLEKSVRALAAVFVDSRVERPKMSGEAVLASVVLDKAGCIVEGTAASVSSFGWGLPKALAGDIRGLGDWPNVSDGVAADLAQRLKRPDEDGAPTPVDKATLNNVFAWLVERFGLPAEFVRPPQFAIRVYAYFRSPDPPSPLLLNSFFLGDLALARRLIGSPNPPANLARYLGRIRPTSRRNLLSDSTALAAAVHPGIQPPARWPGAGRHPLVLLQQAAVNLATSELKGGGILAVNGPPGTGKTTLLRDVVAALVTSRAEAMASFDDPMSAFPASGQRIKSGQSWINIHKLSPLIRGYEMVIASSNNAAVENVSGELPGLAAIAADASGLRYFKPLSDALVGRETWGLIAAVLGNAANRGAFLRTLWSDKEVGIASYLAEASGTPQWIEEKDPTSDALLSRRKPRIIAECDPPASRAQALERWKAARAEFQKALTRSRAALAKLSEVAQAIDRIPLLRIQLMQAENAAHMAGENERKALAAEDAARASAVVDRARRDEVQARDAVHAAARPSWWARAFATSSARSWKVVQQSNLAETAAVSNELVESERRLIYQQQQTRQAVDEKRLAEQQVDRLRGELNRADALVRQGRSGFGEHVVDEAFLALAHDKLHKAVPWCDAATHRLRDDLFEAAIRVHKAFIDAAAAPMLHNLKLATRVLAGWSPPDPEKTALVGDLWSTLFLLVPAVSTTFASVERMFKSVPPEGLGWLLIDEAGQALPQAAVGALMRTKKAVVVGDPIQIEPIVTLPDSLTQAICRQFGVDPDRYNAPDASAQTVADSATAFFTEFHSADGSREVGVPLLVHRRCEAPMFNISNAIAYSNLMVHEKRPSASPIRDCLGPSAWIDVDGDADEKWSPQEGEAVLSLLRKLKDRGVRPDLYIVTPFVIVADKLRLALRGSGVLEEWVDDPFDWTNKRIGTVHTVQGREAEAVIFVLGAPAAQQHGARRWAGGRPNLLNVAVSRAKEALYVVGSRGLWKQAGVFAELDMRL